MTDELAELRRSYADLAALAQGLDEESSWVATGCAGWAVRDLIFHLLGDAQRALVALAEPSERAPDRDAVSYWRDFTGGADPDSRGLRATRTMASAWRLENLVDAYVGTGRAVVGLAARTPSSAVVQTQGHSLTVADLLQTLVVEATVHHLDLVGHLDHPGPGPSALARTRATIDALLGAATPSGWDSASWIRAATGRRALTDDERRALGSAADQVPVLS